MREGRKEGRKEGRDWDKKEGGKNVEGGIVVPRSSLGGLRPGGIFR